MSLNAVYDNVAGPAIPPRNVGIPLQDLGQSDYTELNYHKEEEQTQRER